MKKCVCVLFLFFLISDLFAKNQKFEIITNEDAGKLYLRFKGEEPIFVLIPSRVISYSGYDKNGFKLMSQSFGGLQSQEIMFKFMVPSSKYGDGNKEWTLEPGEVVVLPVDFNFIRKSYAKTGSDKVLSSVSISVWYLPVVKIREIKSISNIMSQLESCDLPLIKLK